MEGTGDNSNGPERRAARILLDIDLNKEPQPEPEEEQVPHNVNPNPQPPAPPRIRVIHDLEEENPKLDMLFDISKMEQNEVDIVVSSNKLARAGKDLEMRGAKVLDDGEISLSLRINNMGEADSNNSSAQKSRARANQELTGPGWKRVRTSTPETNGSIGSPGDAASSSANQRSVPPKIKWKTQDMEGDAEIQNP